jgi:signal peptidase I
VLRELGSLVVKIGIISLVFVLIFTFMFGFQRSADSGMAPTIKHGDLVVFYRLSKDYAVGDLLLLRFQGETQIRRVVARAGDTVDITENGLVINGALQQEPVFSQQTWRYVDGVSFPLTVEEGKYFVLGDARESSIDSRLYGTVGAEDTMGTVITIIRRRDL